MNFGLISLPLWGYAVVALILAHVTIVSVTIYLHRHQAHHALTLHPVVSHFFRFWLWLTTGMSTRAWVAIHRKHHASSDLPGDPHSPQIFGLRKVLREGAELYRLEARNADTIEKFGHSTPDDWIERNVYARHGQLGIVIMLLIDLALFGFFGLTVWAVQMIWIPLFAAGVINGVGHFTGYRNFATNDASRNIVPWGILIGGEELHNNHHAYLRSARFSSRPWEFDIGWMYIRILETLGLAKVRIVAPAIVKLSRKAHCDEQTLAAVIAHRYDVLMAYANAMGALTRAELVRLRNEGNAVMSDYNLLDPSRTRLPAQSSPGSKADWLSTEQMLATSPLLQLVCVMRRDLAALWTRSSASTAQLVRNLEDWCTRAEGSGNDALRQFSLSLRTYASVGDGR